jgi:hypothetical protein
VNSKPAARQDDLGIHAVCCGPNTFTIQRGSPTVYVNGKPFARMNDQTKHCGASGPIIEGSPDVNIDDGASAQGLGSYALNALQILLQSTTVAKPPKQRKKSDTHAGSAGQQQNLATTQTQGHVKSARWSVQRARKDQDVHLFIECTANLIGSLSIEIRLLDADGTPGQKVQSLQENAAPSVKPKWKVTIPPAAGGRNELEFQFVVKDAQGATVNSDTLFVERPRFRFSA